MNILVLNSGSSSLKCQYFIDEQSVATLHIERIGESLSDTKIIHQGKTEKNAVYIPDQHSALTTLFTLLANANILSSIEVLDAVGHRVVHGGTFFNAPTRIDPEVIETIRSLIPLAPLHNPANLEGIEILYQQYPELPQVAVFDTAFHQTLPEYAYRYAIPYTMSNDLHIRRYGFHGTSHAYVAKEAARVLGKPLNTLNLITLHLGNGASATAIRSGKSIDTSMGFTPLEGLMMGTRSGDIDPSVISYLEHHNQMTIDQIDTMLNKESGLKGICGTNDMREIIAKVEKNDPQSLLALTMYVSRIKKYIGAYTAVLGKVDAIIFTGGIGEHSSKVREMVCEGLYDSLGVDIDTQKNRTISQGIHPLASKKSRIKLFIIPTNEELEIALQTQSLLG